MTFKRLETPDILPVSLEDVGAYLRLFEEDRVRDATLLKGLIKAGAEIVESLVSGALLTSTFEETFKVDIQKPKYPMLKNFGKSDMAYRLKIKPFQNIEAVYVKREGFKERELSAEDYRVVIEKARAAVHLVNVYLYDTVRIVYKAGYSDLPETIPSVMRQAILSYVAYAYEHRGDEGKPIFNPQTLHGLLNEHLVYSF